MHLPTTWNSLNLLLKAGSIASLEEKIALTASNAVVAAGDPPANQITEEIVPLAYPSRPATHPASLFAYPDYHTAHLAAPALLSVYPVCLGYLSRIVSYPSSQPILIFLLSSKILTARDMNKQPPSTLSRSDKDKKNRVH